jgi:amino acid permease
MRSRTVDGCEKSTARRGLIEYQYMMTKADLFTAFNNFSALRAGFTTLLSVTLTAHENAAHILPPQETRAKHINVTH